MKNQIVVLAVLLTGLLLALAGGYTAYLQLPSTRSPVSDSPSFRFPQSLNCYLLTDSSPGETWNGITIGRSTWPEVSIRLGAFGVWDQLSGNIRYENDSFIVEACYWNGVVVAVHIIGRRDPARSLEEWIKLYGYPDIVGWTRLGYDFRAVAWTQHGLMILTESDNPGSTDLRDSSDQSVFLFSPIPFDELSHSWLIDALPASPPDNLTVTPNVEAEESWPVTGKSLLEDPWGIATFSP